MSDYSNGGYIPGGPTPVVIHPDECLIRPENGDAVCIRADHPTQTSDCTRLTWIRHR